MRNTLKVLRYIFLFIQIVFLLLVIMRATSGSFILPIVNILFGSLGIFISSVSVMRLSEDSKDRRLTFTIFGAAVASIIISLLIIVVKFVMRMI